MLIGSKIGFAGIGLISFSWLGDKKLARMEEIHPLVMGVLPFGNRWEKYGGESESNKKDQNGGLRLKLNKLQKLEDALIEQMLTAADLADRGDRGDQGDHGDWGDSRNG